MEEILRQFPLKGEPVGCTPLSGGHINQSFLVATDAGCRYVLQYVNGKVFRDAEAIMENLRLIRDWLCGRGESVPIIEFIDTCDGRAVYRDRRGAWRLSPFVEDSICLQRPESAEDCRQAALAFGCFLYALRDFPAERLNETIPHFHDTPERCRRLLEAAEADPYGRRAGTERELAYVRSRTERASVLQRLRDSGELPLSVTHNDTRLPNVLLDAKTHRALCVIDPDTVMPGLALCDLGDTIRSCAASAEGVLNLPFCAACVRAFRQACPHLREREWELLPLAIWTMSFECAVRYLTDFLSGDAYFSDSGLDQKLARARTGFALAADVEKKWDQILQMTAGNSSI